MRLTLGVVVAAAAVSLGMQQDDIYQRVSGRWRWEFDSTNCKDDGHEISFTSDRRHMLLVGRYGKSRDLDTTRYEILGLGPSAIRGRITDEQRRTESGEPVAWDLILFERNRYCWRRTDWSGQGCTQPVVRCPQT